MSGYLNINTFILELLMYLSFFLFVTVSVITAALRAVCVISFQKYMVDSGLVIICKAVKVIFIFGTNVKIFLSILHSWFPIWIQLVCLPNLPSLVTIYSDKKTIRVNTSYFSFFFPNKLMTTEIVLKGKILCWLTKWVK